MNDSNINNNINTSRKDKIKCSRCLGSGIESYHRHGPGDEDVESIRCSVCDGFGFHFLQENKNIEFDRGFDAGFKICQHEIKNFLFNKININPHGVLVSSSFVSEISEILNSFHESIGFKSL